VQRLPGRPVGNAPTGSTFDLAMYVPTGGLPVTGGTSTAASTAATAASTGSRPQITTAR
jgi:hypothetical protein